MKKTILALAAASVALAMLASCKKETCTCGTIVSDRVSDYSIVIKNECSGNEKRFNLSRDNWMTAYVGTEYCITNEAPW